MTSPRSSPPSAPSRAPAGLDRTAPARTAAPRTVRRSVALPRALVERVSEAAPPEYRGNLNGIVRLALEEFVARRDREAFEREMAEMASDARIRDEVRRMHRDMEGLDDQGLPRP